MTEETLYPHEQVIKILNAPNTFFEALTWGLFSFSIATIQIFVIYGMIIMSSILHKPLDAIYGLSTGLNICACLTLVLFSISILGVAQWSNQ